MSEKLKFPKWIGVDFDNTLQDKDGQPIWSMVDKVNEFLDQGKTVKIFTARTDVAGEYGIDEINDFCKEHFGKELEITNKKDPGMEVLYDDRTINPTQDENMLQGISHLAGIMKERVLGQKKGQKITKKSRLLGAIKGFSRGVKKGSYAERYGS